MKEIRRWEWIVVAVMVAAFIAAIALMSQGGKVGQVTQVPTVSPPPPTGTTALTTPAGSAAAPPTPSEPPPDVPPSPIPIPATPTPSGSPHPPSAVVPAPARPSHTPPPEDAGERCRGNLRQLSLGIRMYYQDYDERMPVAAQWCAVVGPYIRNNDLLCCPAFANPYGYAFNANLSRATVPRGSSESTIVMLFDSSAGRTNAADTGQTLCRPPRHPRGNNFAYLDGHVRPSGAPQTFALTASSTSPPSSRPAP